MPREIFSCHTCWWREGKQCYENKSVRIAGTHCDKFLGKRAMLERFISSEKLIITSEHRYR